MQHPVMDMVMIGIAIVLVNFMLMRTWHGQHKNKDGDPTHNRRKGDDKL